MRNQRSPYSISNLPELFLRKRGMLTYLILGIALVGFEAINFSTTQYALTDLLGPVTFASIQWATILSIAFCGIDFAGIARLFAPEEADDRTREIWFLFGAWLLAATMNAMLTWWGISMALTQHTIRSTEIIDRKLLLQAVPVIVALMVWVTRILLIGSFSRAGHHPNVHGQAGYSPTFERARTNYRSVHPSSQRPIQQASQTVFNRPQPVTQQAYDRPQPVPAPMPTPAPLVTSRPIPSPAPMRSNNPQRKEPEYIPDGEAPTPASLPSLRPLTAFNARPTGSNNEKRF